MLCVCVCLSLQIWEYFLCLPHWSSFLKVGKNSVCKSGSWLMVFVSESLILPYLICPIFGGKYVEYLLFQVFCLWKYCARVVWHYFDILIFFCLFLTESVLMDIKYTSVPSSLCTSCLSVIPFPASILVSTRGMHSKWFWFHVFYSKSCQTNWSRFHSMKIQKTINC